MFKKLLITVLALIPSLGFACEWHQAPSFGVFGAGQYSPNPQHFSATVKKLTVDHVKQVIIQENEQSSIELTYTAPLSYRDVKLDVEPSSGINVLSKKNVELTQLRGSVDLQFKAKSGGQHHITLQISATNKGNPVKKLQRIVVNVI